MKSLFAGSKHVFAAAQVLGMLVSYFLVLRFLNEAVLPEQLPTLLIITYVSGFVCSFVTRKNSVWIDLLISFLAYNLATYVYLTYLALSEVTDRSVFSNSFYSAVFMALGYPVVFKALIPAVLTSIGVLSLYRKLNKS